ncbi:hypothetical protein PLICRDRAFT_693861 [Plicaturopsis crispa FD-325 SS-3]|nr:hypothetical protein PLICRDRAFT_693861 [Plicaturopsis crispa FD-325 SS-3]
MMALPITLHHVNGDTTWLLSAPTLAATGNGIRVFNILIDPWLSGWQTDYSRIFSRQKHVVPSFACSIPELEAQLGVNRQKIDAILVCHDFTDHCNEATLRLANSHIPVFASPSAARKIARWNIFDAVHEIPVVRTEKAAGTNTLVSRNGKTLRDMHINTTDPSSCPENISIIYIPTDRWDMAGIRLHAATVITVSVPSGSPHEQGSSYCIVYAPHGTSPSSLQPWVDAHPSVTCLALIHGLDEIDNPWYLAGPLNLGARSGPALCALLRPRYWIQTHDETKQAEGFIAHVLKRTPWTAEACDELLRQKGVAGTKVIVLNSGASLELVQ